MKKIKWMYLIALVALVSIAVLRWGGKVSEGLLKQVFFFILGALFGGGATYQYMRAKKLEDEVKRSRYDTTVN